MDLNHNGIVDNGRELFGNNTQVLPEITVAAGATKRTSFAPNGYLALLQYDHAALGGNQDGQIDQNDNVYDLLQLWTDRNADGICSPDEVMPLHQSGILKLNIEPKANSRTDQAGNGFYLWNWAEKDGRKVKTSDVWFAPIY